MSVVPKQVLAPGHYCIDGEIVEFTPAHVLSIGKSSQSAVRDGLPIRFPKEHQDYALPYSDARRKAADVNYNKGFIKNYFLDKIDKSLWMNVNVPDEKFAGRLISGEVPFVSPRIDPWFRAGSGKIYKNVITHVAATCNPIAANQKPFGSVPGQPIALSSTPAATFMSHREQENKPICFSLADQVVRQKGKWVYVNQPGRPPVSGDVKPRKPRAVRLSQAASAGRLSTKLEGSRMKRISGHALYMSAGESDNWEYVIEGPAVEAEHEREKWLNNVKTGNKVTIEFEDGGKLIAHVVAQSEADGDHGGDDGIVKFQTEAGEEIWLGKKGDYKGRKITAMKAEPDKVNPEDEETRKKVVVGAANKTPSMVAKMSSEAGDQPNFGGASQEGDEDDPDDEDEDEDEDDLDDQIDEDEEPAGGKKADDCVEAAKKALEEHDPPIHISEDCKSPKELCENLVVALHAINKREESLDQDDASDEAMRNAHQEPQVVAMSAAISNDPAVKAMQLSLQRTEKRLAKRELLDYERRFAAVVKDKRMPGDRATKCMTTIAKKQMSLANGQVDEDVIKAIARLEAAEELAVPESDLFEEQTEGYKLSVPEIPEYSKNYGWGAEQKRESEEAKSAQDEMIAMANRAAGGKQIA